MAEQAFGYDKERKVKDLVIVLFKDELASIIDSGKLTNEAHIFMRDWRDSRQYGAMYKQGAEIISAMLAVAANTALATYDQLTYILADACINEKTDTFDRLDKYNLL